MFDDGLRQVGVVPSSVPEAIKLTAWRLLSKRGVARENVEASLHDRAGFFAYCITGREAFEEVNGVAEADEMERRLELAAVFEEGPDAEMVLLALHAGLAHETTAGRFSTEQRDTT